MYSEHAPSHDLSDVVACTWEARSSSDASGRSPVLADACSDIVVIGDSAPHIAGPATRTHFVDVAPSTLVVGIRFKPGAARAVFGCDATELVDAHVDLHDVCGRAAEPLTDALRAESATTAARAALERWVRARLEARRRRDAAVLHAARQLMDPHQSIAALGDTLGWSARRLHREFTATCGYSPKYLQRILRLQRALRRARAMPRPNGLSSLALDAGYADQAHMTRDFRDLTGFTPRELLARSNADVGQWLDVERGVKP